MKDIKSGDLVRVSDKTMKTLQWPEMSGLVIKRSSDQWVVLWSNGMIVRAGNGWLEKVQ